MGIRNLIFNKFKFPTKGRVDPRIIEKQVLVREKIEKAREEGRYCFFESPYAQVFLSKTIKDNDYERYETFYNMIDSWDSVCHLSLETGQYASNLWLSDTSKVPAIHRTYLSDYTNTDGIPTCEDLRSIMEDGLINYGHALQGGITEGDPSLALTTTPLNSFTGMINLIGSYKHNNTTIVLQFPGEYVDKDLNFKNAEANDVIYDKSTGNCVIKPEFILGAIVKSENGFDQFYSKEQLLSVEKKQAL